MAEFEEKREAFRDLFVDCRPALSALGDRTRQLMIKYLIEHCGEGGVRVGELQKATGISRTALSHHLRILKDSGIIAMRRAGTKNYYSLDPRSSSLRLVVKFWEKAEEMMTACETNTFKGIEEERNEGLSDVFQPHGGNQKGGGGVERSVGLRDGGG